jgi:ribosome-binding protein aMBF1 (putative translation factor)
MKTWNDYKEHVRAVDPEGTKTIQEAENLASIVGAMIEQRNALGISQRELATICGIPQSSVARIESFKTTPNLNTLLKIFQSLGLKLIVSVPPKSRY